MVTLSHLKAPDQKAIPMGAPLIKDNQIAFVNVVDFACSRIPQGFRIYVFCVAALLNNRRKIARVPSLALGAPD